MAKPVVPPAVGSAATVPAAPAVSPAAAAPAAPRAVNTLDLRWWARRRRVPVVLQGEVAECGLACLAMVAGAHGLQTDLPTLRQRFSLSARGVALPDLVRMAEALKLQARVLRAELHELRRLNTPCVLHWEMNHFVVLEGWQGDAAVILDPARGRRLVREAELSRCFTGIAVEMQPMPGFETGRQRLRLRVADLIGPVQGWRRALASVLMLALALEAFVLLSPLLLQWVVDGVLPSADRELLTTLALGFALLVLLQAATSAARAWALLVASAQLNLRWLANVFAHLLRLPMAWFDKRQTGDVWSRFGAVQQIQRTLTTQFVEALLDGTLVVLTLAMMLAYSPLLTAFSVAAVALYALARQLAFGAQREALEEALVHESRQSGHFLESLRGVQVLRLFGAEAERGSRFSSLVVDSLNAQLAVRRLEIRLATLNRLLFGLERVAVVTMGALLVLEQRFSLGMLFAFLAWKETFAQRVGSLVDKAAELRMLRLHAERLADIVLTAPEQAGDPAPMSQDDQEALAPARIELRGVSFRYGASEREVLSKLNLVIEPGEALAIVGPSGCGKTTLLKLLLGLYTPTAGEILIDGRPLGPASMARWRAGVGAVMQEDLLFAGSIADNIAFFDAVPDGEWVRQCARLAGVHDEIAAMPMGYATLVGDLGAPQSGLSGGQKQRILLARALYRRPRVLLLDEATSSLDVERERAVNLSVRQLSLTRVIVAHRPETIAAASRVVSLLDGRVVTDLRSVPPAFGS